MKKTHLLAAAAVAALAAPAFAQTGGQNVDWPLYLGDVSGSKFKPLDQINASNFSNLEVAWRFKTDNMGNRARVSSWKARRWKWMAWSMPPPVRAAPWWRWTR